MSGTPTFWLETTDQVQVGLRRYTPSRVGSTSTCDGGYHTGFEWLGRRVANRNELGYLTQNGLSFPPESERWPRKCESCDYEFTEDDPYQVWQEEIYRRADNHELRTLHWRYVPPGIKQAEPGATWNAWWNGDSCKGSDGISLMVRLSTTRPATGMPADWSVDSPSSTGGRWTRTGDPRAANVTASPSILIGSATRTDEPFYHGFLQGGVLTESLAS